MMNNGVKKYFEENGYVIIKNFIKPEISNLLYEYTKLKSRRALLKEAKNPDLYYRYIDGDFEDPQAPGACSLYGDPIMDALLQNSTKFISDTIQIDLIPTYSYWRLYITDNVLEKHKDRPSCEYSTTLSLGYDTSNVTDTKYNWPIYIKSYKGDIKPVELDAGDMVIYKGCDVEHWRDAYKGLNHSQVFLHFNKKNGEYNKSLNDERDFLGLPSINVEIQEV